VTDDTRAAFRPFTVDPAWYRAHWFAEGKPAPSRRAPSEIGHRPSGLARVPSVVGSALAAAAAALGAVPSRQAVGRS
jgi:hypothetical protein